MSYSYSNPLTYGPQNSPLVYDGMEVKEKNNTVPLTLGGALAGGVAGGFIAHKKNPFMSSDTKANDTFTKQAYDKYTNKVGGDELTINKQNKEILKKIDKVKTPEELKTLLNENSLSAKQALNNSYDDIINNVTEHNMDANKKTIKSALKTQNETNIQKMKNWIEVCWDAKGKKFEKAGNVTDDAFNAIKEATNGVKGKLITKYALISAAIGGVGAYIATKLLSAPKEEPVVETPMEQQVGIQ